MSDDDEFDELPPISVNSLRDECMFAMPTAEELASQRAREERVERALRDGCAGAEGAPRGDSSESEGEEALAAAVDALLVEPGGSARRRLSARDLLAEMMAALPRPHPPFLEEFHDTVSELQAPAARAMVYELAVSVGELVALEEEPWSEEETTGVGLWLCAALAWSAPPVPRLRVARALRTLLADRCDAAQAHALGAACCAAFADTRTRLALCDAVAGAVVGADHFADALLGAALADALHLQQPIAREGLEELVSRQWRTLEEGARLAALRPLGRAMARGWLRGGVPGALAPPAAAVPAHHSLDRLEVAPKVSKLRCLFAAGGT
ncbi:hypothetical protein K1T71_013433 [Dendrolimus kikuchii]|uniref:Uncharacterized protein n=1 Tax=Dendrolimus kikuchii TaxID=765133 RepID=A0ACC1CGN7_9NEOP|nr:hypothetical protein K1T71_013433 [Dendrolimus kikuchii]